jgi:hypothetical protein
MGNVITRESVIFTELISKIRTMETEVEMMKENNLSCSAIWINGDEIMQKLGISKRTLQNYRDNGILPYSAIGGKFYYSIKDLERLMMKNYVSTDR